MRDLIGYPHDVWVLSVGLLKFNVSSRLKTSVHNRRLLAKPLEEGDALGHLVTGRAAKTARYRARPIQFPLTRPRAARDFGMCTPSN